MVIFQGILILHSSWIIIQVGLRKLELTWRQTVCLFGFLSSLILAFIAEALTATRDSPGPPPLHMTAASVQVVPMILWVVIGVIFTASAVLIIAQEMSRIAHSRGFTNPIPLTRYDNYNSQPHNYGPCCSC
jgi:tryptophan-rich sensory protein